MQHALGRPYHRTTEWRRRKADERGAVGKHRGRDFSIDVYGEGFVRFTAAVIHAVNENGHCDYGSIVWPREKPPASPFALNWPPAPESLYSQLADSGFPPAMIAVAICRVVPLNFKTRLGARAERLTLREGAIADLRRENQRVTEDAYSLAHKRRQLEEVLRNNETPERARREYLREAEKCHFEADWVRTFLREHQPRDKARGTGRAPMKESCKGTPAHRVQFPAGARLTRRMESYWKHHPRFEDCLRFLVSLFFEPDKIPRAPYKGRITMVDPELNKEFSLAWKLRRNREPPTPRQGPEAQPFSPASSRR